MNSQDSRRDLTTGIVWKRLMVFFLPIAAGTCIQQLYNAVDGLIVGRFVGTLLSPPLAAAPPRSSTSSSAFLLLSQPAPLSS